MQPHLRMFFLAIQRLIQSVLMEILHPRNQNQSSIRIPIELRKQTPYYFNFNIFNTKLSVQIAKNYFALLHYWRIGVLVAFSYVF